MASTPTAPSLNDLAAHPEQVAALPLESIPALLAQLAALQSALAARLLTAPNGHPDPAGEDRLLSVRVAAARLGVSCDWLYRRGDTLPFAVRLGRQLRFSAAGIERYIAQRKGRG